MGGSSPILFLHYLLFFLLIITTSHYFMLVHSFPSLQQQKPLCHHDDNSALLHFGQSLSIIKSIPISLDLQFIQRLHRGILVAVITAHGTVSLVMMTLPYNWFNHSQIPSAIGLLLRLPYLNLSYSVFAGQIPLEISNLTKLTSLDLSRNLVELLKPGLTSLVQNLMDLKQLHLSRVKISSQFLNVKDSPDLSGYLPEFHKRSPLKELGLSRTNFSGVVPNSIGNLHSLNKLDMSQCNFTGSIPYSFGNLAKLLYLSLLGSNFFRELPNSVGQLKSLNHLEMVKYLLPLIPYSLGNFTQLLYLRLSSNLLHGPIPESISRLMNLEVLYLDGNNLNGIVELDVFLTLKNLTTLELSSNQLTLFPSSFINATLPKFMYLGLNSCNLTEFPDFLKTKDELLSLTLSNNNIQVPLPTWIWNTSTQTLETLDLSQNLITGAFLEHPVGLLWDRLWLLDLSSNMLQGPLLVPSSSIQFYNVANNKLTGEIPQLICNASSLRVLDLTYNNLSGTIPHCLASFSDSLELLNLRNNKLRGPIPQTYKNGTQLRMINLSQNQLEGPMLNLLVNCSILESLDLGNNQIDDIFPFWLQTLPE
ncbi:receptor-like protein 7 [Cornus florida]|uniref:receptor-like protein 7 n=1 Tax=Cornus florida TaxID=4283 RepID=UPI00289A2710|nr:receptor-like protein 7 [Cornus florida]